MKTKKIIDLSFPIHEGMTTFPAHWHPLVEITQLGRHGLENRETRKLVFGTHTGTHIDAPLHFIPKGQSIDRIPLERFMGKAAVINLTPIPSQHELSLSELKRKVGKAKNEILLLRTDWSLKWEDKTYYTHYPYLSLEATKWLVKRQTKLLGLDTPSPDNPNHNRHAKLDSPNHKLLLGKDVILVEYLCNLAAIHSSEVNFLAMPLKIRNGDGSPTRCVALEIE